jgi:hypothetical protein
LSSVTVTPRATWAANGKLVLVNSPGRVATRLPSGMDAATSPRAEDTVPAIVTESSGTPTNAA